MRSMQYRIPILVISIVLLVLDLLLFGVTIGLSPDDLVLASRRSLFAVYWLGFPLLFTAIIGIIAGVKKPKAFVIAFLVLSTITCVLAALLVICLPLVLFIVCGLSASEHPDRKDPCLTQPIQSLYIVLVTDAVVIWIGTLIASIFACKLTCCTTVQTEPEVITLTPLNRVPPEDVE